MSEMVKERTGLAVLESIEQKISQAIAPTVPRKRESDDLKEYYKALHSAQVKFKSIDKTGSILAHGVKRMYAKIDDLVEASRAALHANNLVCTTYCIMEPTGFERLVTRLYHWPSGQWTESELPLLNSQEEQKRGSSITYAWRYTYAPLMGLVDSSYDDDGEISKSTVYKK
jgi:hypothetical protein